MDHAAVAVDSVEDSAEVSVAVAVVTEAVETEAVDSVVGVAAEAVGVEAEVTFKVSKKHKKVVVQNLPLILYKKFAKYFRLRLYT